MDKLLLVKFSVNFFQLLLLQKLRVQTINPIIATSKILIYTIFFNHFSA